MKCSFHKLMTMSLMLQLFSFMSPPASGGQVNFPHEFNAGTTAKASEVNANFSNIGTAVNDNDSRIATNASQIANVVAANVTMQSRLRPVVLDGNNNEIGLLVDVEDSSIYINAITAQGYIITRLSLSQGFIGSVTLLFSSDNCTGTPFVFARAGAVAQTYDLSGNVGLYYVSKDSLATDTLTIRSSTSPSGCVARVFPFISLWPALPNDPAVTGVTTLSYQLPIRIERQ